MGRNVAAAEIQELIGQMQQLAQRGESLAMASGGMVQPMHFRGIQTMLAGAAGDLDQKGLLLQPVEPKE